MKLAQLVAMALISCFGFRLRLKLAKRRHTAEFGRERARC
jgi:uncharacterized OsmC-like protein